MLTNYIVSFEQLGPVLFKQNIGNTLLTPSLQLVVKQGEQLLNSLATDDLIIQSSSVSKCSEIQILLTIILEEIKKDYS